MIPHPPTGSGCFVPPDKVTRKKHGMKSKITPPTRVFELWLTLEDPENSGEFLNALWAHLGVRGVNKQLRAWLDEHSEKTDG